MRTKYFAIGLTIGFMGLVMYSRVHAEPPPPMWSGVMAQPIVVCDTKEQAEAIIEAGRDNAQGMLAKYEELFNILDAHNEPTCANSPPFSLTVNEREDKGITHGASGTPMHTWIVHGGNPLGDFWFIYAEGISTAKDTSI